MSRKNRSKPRQKTLHIASPTLHMVCREKRRFPTEKQAAHAAETQELLKPELRLTTYQCPQCKGWHLARVRN